jgi:hypothetical protein
LKIKNQDEARKVLSKVNEKSRQMLADFYELQKNLTELERFFRSDSENYKNFTNVNSIRIAGNEIARISRKVPPVGSVLKHLSNITYPLTFTEEPFVYPKKESPNKINKNVVVPKINLEDEE